MWDVDSAIIVPIIVSGNGLIAKSLEQYPRRLSLGLGSWIRGLTQKAVLLDTARIVRRVVAWTLFQSTEPVVVAILGGCLGPAVAVDVFLPK